MWKVSRRIIVIDKLWWCHESTGIFRNCLLACCHQNGDQCRLHGTKWNRIAQFGLSHSLDIIHGTHGAELSVHWQTFPPFFSMRRTGEIVDLAMTNQQVHTTIVFFLVQVLSLSTQSFEILIFTVGKIEFVRFLVTFLITVVDSSTLFSGNAVEKEVNVMFFPIHLMIGTQF